MQVHFNDTSKKTIQRHIGRRLTRLEEEALSGSYDRFYLFVQSIYKWAMEEHYGEFVGGNYIRESCRWMQSNPWTLYLGPREHWKSSRYYAYLMWQLWRNRFKPFTKDFRVLYGSYRFKLSEEHIYNIKELIASSVMGDLKLKDEKSHAEGLARYTWDGKNKLRIKGFGMLEGIRGGHAEITMVDDALRDEKNPNAKTMVYQINELFVKVVMSIPINHSDHIGELHVIGTPQTEEDFYFDQNVLKEFAHKYEPSIYVVDGVEYALWPERHSLASLQKKRETRKVQTRGGAVSFFDQEYMCKPRTAANSYFDADILQSDHGLQNMDFWTFPGQNIPFDPTYALTVGGYDPGKKVHPGHFVVLEVTRDGKLRQLLSKWFDHIDYTVPGPQGYSQLGYILQAIEKFGIGSLYVDNTRGELTTVIEQNLIPGLEPIHINNMLKNTMAVELDSALASRRLLLCPDERQLRSLSALQGDLSLVQTQDGHGEAFTSLGLPVVHTLAPEMTRTRPSKMHYSVRTY